MAAASLIYGRIFAWRARWVVRRLRDEDPRGSTSPALNLMVYAIDHGEKKP